jgi:hypothetical protein
VAPSNPRLATGVGVLAACLLIGGPGAAAAIADPGGSHSGGSDRGSGAERGGGHSRGGSKDDDRRDNGNSRRNDNRADKGDDNRRGDGDGDDHGNRRSSGNGNDYERSGSAEQGSDDAPVRVGSGRDDIATVTPENGSGNGSGANSSAAPAPGFGIVSPPDGGSDSAGGSGSDPGVPPAASIPTVTAQPATPGASVASPPVTVGNGRSPAILSDDPAPRLQAPAPVTVSLPPPPAEPPPPPAASWADRFSAPPATAKQLAVAAPVDLNGPMWAIAGLLLIPAAGAALGYRQARAAHAADRLRRTGTAAQVLAQDLS